MNLKLGIILDKKTNIKKIDSIVEEILFPYLTSSPIKEVFFGEKYTKSEMKDIYRTYKMENYQGISNKKKSEDLVNKGIDTLEGFAKEMYGIIRFTEDGEAVINFNPRGFIDEYEIENVDKIKNFEEDFLALKLKSLIDMDLKVYQREFQIYKLTPSTILKPIIDKQNKSNYIVLINYSY